MKRLLTGLGLLVLTLLSPVGCGKPRIKQECVMNGFGNGSCSFTNLGDGKGAVCGKIVVQKAQSDSERIASGDFCSGQVEPKSTTKVEFSVPNVRTFCKGDEDQKWTEVCAFLFEPDAASVVSSAPKPRTLEEAFGVGGRGN